LAPITNKRLERRRSFITALLTSVVIKSRVTVEQRFAEMLMSHHVASFTITKLGVTFSPSEPGSWGSGDLFARLDRKSMWLLGLESIT
jgi:hypothetical protein